MKTLLSVVTALIFSSQLSFAEVQDNAIEAIQPEAAGELHGQPAPQALEQTATDSQVKSLEHDLGPSLQSKLDALMSSELDTQPVSSQAIASVN